VADTLFRRSFLWPTTFPLQSELSVADLLAIQSELSVADYNNNNINIANPALLLLPWRSTLDIAVKLCWLFLDPW
jgi:hypothetical protein